MTESLVGQTSRDIKVNLTSEWACDRQDSSTVWFKGRLPRSWLDQFHNSLREISPTRFGFEKSAAQLDENFGIVAQCDRTTIAITDHCNSVPILFGRGDSDIIGSSGSDIARCLSLGLSDISLDAALSVAMSGYTIGNDTLYPSIQIMSPGSVMVLHPGQPPEVSNHHVYRPWVTRDDTRERLKGDLGEKLSAMIERLIASADGRPIVVPLSAGLDSRVIVSGLKEFGYRDVHCFSYGLYGNHETITSQKIAYRLGYNWTFVPYSIGRQRDVFESEGHKAFKAACDHLSGVHFEQEYLALRELTDLNWIPKDAIFVNGQSGDFISGNHIPANFHHENYSGDTFKIRKNVVETLFAKHFALWQSLATSEHKRRIESRLEQALPEGQPEEFTDFGLFEWSEFRDRQCKYVVQNVRVYEHFGYEWRMPLWDADYMRFWARAPLSARKNQNLYREVLHELDWGQVWQQIPVNKKAISPHWIRPLRFVCKLMHAPLGRARWHAFERQFLNYWMNNLCCHAIVPYWHVAGDGRGHRSAVSWLAREYLRRKGFDDIDFDARQAA